MINRTDLDEIITKLTLSTRNNTLDAAAKVAKLYGAPAEACERILMLKATALETPLSKEPTP